jgi:hypothetical protein
MAWMWLWKDTGMERNMVKKWMKSDLEILSPKIVEGEGVPVRYLVFRNYYW